MRFRSYTGSWDKIKLNNVCKINPKTPDLKNEFYYIDLESVIKGELIYKNRIFKTEAPSRAQRVLSYNDICFQCVRPYQLNNYHFKIKDDNQWVASTGYAQLRPYRCNPSFIYQLINSKQFNNEVLLRCTGSSYPAINSNDLGEIEISICDTEEQIKISKFLTLIDKRIATQNKIIEDLIIKKKIISDKLFSQIPTHRNNLSFYYVKGKAGGTPKSTNKKFYDGEIPFLSISDMTEQGKYIYRTEKTLTQEGLNNSTAWIVPKDSLLLSMYASVGQVAINRIPLTTSQAIFSMTITDKTILDYLYYYLSYFKENKLHRYLETGTQSNINADFVKGIEIPDYGYCKNKLIVSLLFLMDEKIKKEKDILSLYKKQKAYLLQNMFI